MPVKKMPNPDLAAQRPLTRRAVVKTLALGAAGAAALPTRRARGAAAPQSLALHDPAAPALGDVGNFSQGARKK